MCRNSLHFLNFFRTHQIRVHMASIGMRQLLERFSSLFFLPVLFFFENLHDSTCIYFIISSVSSLFSFPSLSGTPIVGDPIYCSKHAQHNVPFLLLASRSLTFTHPRMSCNLLPVFAEYLHYHLSTSFPVLVLSSHFPLHSSFPLHIPFPCIFLLFLRGLLIAFFFVQPQTRAKRCHSRSPFRST